MVPFLDEVPYLYEVHSSVYDRAYPVPLERFAVGIMINGRPNAMPSPCGANCSYTIQFEGPYLECVNNTKKNITYTYRWDAYPQIYQGRWDPFSSVKRSSTSPLPKYSEYFLNTTIMENPFALSSNSDHDTLIVTTENLVCRPFRAMYTIGNKYEIHIQTLDISAKPVEQLVNVEGFQSVPGFCQSGSGQDNLTPGLGYGSLPANWSDVALAWYRDLNMMNIIGSTLIPLMGYYTAHPVNLKDFTIDEPDDIVFVDQTSPTLEDIVTPGTTMMPTLLAQYPIHTH
jgi:hypothetical protein